MKPAILAIFLALPLPASATTPQQDARELLAYLKQTRAEVNRAGKAGDKVALQRIERDALQRWRAWPNDERHANYMDCHTALTDMLDFLRADRMKDKPWRERKVRQFRDSLAACDQAVKAKRP